MEWKCKEIAMFFLGLFWSRRRQKNVYMQRHQGVKCKHLDIRDMIYHKFSHSAASYTLSGENVNVMIK